MSVVPEYQDRFESLTNEAIEYYNERLKIKKQFSLFRPRYNMNYKGWRLEGDFLQWNYDVYEQSRLVVHISKQLFKWGDTYVLDIANDADELPALMVAIAMDAAKCSEDDNRNSMI